MSRVLVIIPVLIVGVLCQATAQELPDPAATDPTAVAPAEPAVPRRVAPAPTRVGPTAIPAGPNTPAIVRPLPPVEYYDGYERPRDAVHRAAALKAAQRRQRIAAHKAMGYSPLRPPASPVPIMSGHSPWSIIRPPLHIPTVVVGSTRPVVVIERPVGLGGF